MIQEPVILDCRSPRNCADVGDHVVGFDMFGIGIVYRVDSLHEKIVNSAGAYRYAEVTPVPLSALPPGTVLKACEYLDPG